MFLPLFCTVTALAANWAAATSDWVVQLPSGRSADVVAGQLNLLNKGEVVPGTNLYHFQQDSRRARRSTLHLSAQLQIHPHIERFESQTQVLSRVRRLPVAQNLARCFINTVATETKQSKRCVFPFIYKKKTYTSCTSDHSTNKREWCATQVNAAGIVIKGQWGDCAPSDCGEPNPPLRTNDQSFPPLPLLGQGQPEVNPERFDPFVNQPFPPFRQPASPPRSFNGAQNPPRQLPFVQGFDPNFLFSLAGNLGGQQFNRAPPKKEEVWPKVDLNSLRTKFNDEAWPSIWYLNRGGKTMDMNVEDAWEQGATGEGVVVSILDDGVEWNHPDLEENYDPEASTDLNEGDRDPFPRYDFTNSNKHGTRCAGTVAAVANNSICAVGVAYKAKVGGVRILDGNILDVLEAKSLSFNRDHIDIYSASWGPDDNGKTVDGPGPLAKLALREGVNKGRKGKGSIFVWASGNGGKHFDNCNCDGYTTSIYTLSVSSVSEQGKIPWYSEPCSSSLTTTYSSGSSKRLNERKVVTTDLHGMCTSQHTGTSASSPMAAGIVALALDVNPDLTWRDMQHIIVRTSLPRGHLKAADWDSNAVGLEFSHSYGFGLMDAGAIVRLAKNWTAVPEAKNCSTTAGRQSFSNPNAPVEIKPSNEEAVALDATSCDAIAFIEHVHLNIDLDTGAKRGDLSILLRSPGGTVSILLAPRPLDDVRTGFQLFKNWPMMSVHFWGEYVADEEKGAQWVLLVRNDGDRPAFLNDWSLTFYGTSEDPQSGLAIRPLENTSNSNENEENREDGDARKEADE